MFKLTICLMVHIGKPETAQSLQSQQVHMMMALVGGNGII
jgi:hypothetical protein